MKRICLAMILILLFLSSCAGSNIFDSSTTEMLDKLTADEAVQLIANLYYNGETNSLYYVELPDNNYVVELLIDGGSGLLQIYGAYLIVDGKVINSLWNDAGEFNDQFWGEVDGYR